METPIEQSFAALLRAARQRTGLTQAALAERAGISTRAVSDLERGINRAPQRETLHLLATALHLSPAEERRWRAVARQLSRRPQRAAAPPSAVFATPPLPVPLTTLVGREDEVAALGALLCGGARLITLTGPGGVGKTRVALAVAAAHRETFAGEVAFVPLAALRDADLVLATIAGTLAIREKPNQPILQTLTAELVGRRMLLVLDNLEQVIDAAPGLAQLLAACPALVLLVTSRAPLHITGEQEFPVSPLGLPDSLHAHSREWIARSAAVTLFIQRAQEHRPDFRLTPEDAPVTAEICQRLDGLPLAIELAAPWLKVLGLRTLRDRLEQRLPLLSGDAVDHLPRQRTMREVIAWSYDLLPTPIQALFRALSVFAGGWALDVTQAICPSGIDPLAGLAALIDQSLVQHTTYPDGDRYSMLETVRDFGLE
jgi:predicted ATPase/transcriptional regulator with XRE-family HTH domain